jgi:xanthine dehydrogenase small subunit
MRASAAFRSEVLGNLMQRFWLESQGQTQINLDSVMPGLLLGSAVSGAPHEHA